MRHTTSKTSISNAALRARVIAATTLAGLTLLPLAARAETLSNNYLTVSVDDAAGFYDIDTTGGTDGDDTLGDDNNKTLIYGSGGTSASAVFIDGSVWSFDQDPVESLTNDGQALRALWRNADVTVNRSWSLVPSTSGFPDMVRLETTIQNTGAANHSVALFTGIDTMVGDNDGAPLFSGAGIIQTETMLSGADVPNSWQAFENDDVANPGLTAQGVLDGGDAVKPDRFLLGNWPNGVGRFPDYTGDGSNIADFNDTAVSMWWDDRPLSPGAALTIVTYYGVGSGTTVQGDLALNLSAPAILTIDANNQLSPNPFDVNLAIANNHGYTADDVTATLTLPAGLTLISGPTAQNAGSIAAGDTALVTWQVEATPPAPGTGGTADPADLSEGSPAALAALAFVNSSQTTLAILDDDASLASNAAQNIIAHRNGADGVLGTGDDDLFDTIAELDAISFVGPATLEAIAVYAIENGFAQGGGGNAIYTMHVEVTASNDTATYEAERAVEVPPVVMTTLEGLDVTVHTTDAEDFETIEMIVSVNDADDGTFLDDLDETNFSVTEDGVPMENCTVELVQDSTSEANADIVFVFDVTGSMEDEIEDLRASVIAFADDLEVSNIDYRLGLVTFSEDVLGVFGMTDDASEFRSWVQAVSIDPFGGIENPLDGVVEGMNLPLRDSSDRIFILATDETFNVYAHSLAQTTQIAQGNNVRVHAATLPELNADYDPLVSGTGGSFFDLTANFGNVLGEVSAEIINRYVIRCDTPNAARDNTWRDVNVEVTSGSEGGEDSGTYFIAGGALRIDDKFTLAQVGSSFTVDVVAESVSDLQNAHLVLNFDASYLQFDGAAPGELLGRDASTGPVPAPLVLLGVGHDPANGRLEIDVARQVTEGTDGTGVLCTLNFTLTDIAPEDFDAQGVIDPNQADDLVFDIGASGVYLENDAFDVIAVTSVSNGDIDSEGGNYLLGDFDTDGDIDLVDFNILVANWGSTSSDLLSGNIGPASGSEPNLIPSPDAVVNFHDLFVFTRMYNWYRAQ